MTGTQLPDLTTIGIGIITPYDFALDRELWRWTPDGATLHITRLPYAAPEVTVDMVAALGDSQNLIAGTAQLMTVAPRVVVYACTSGSFVHGTAGEAEIRRTLLGAGAAEATTTSGSISAALDRLGSTRISIATPYTRDLTDRLADFLGEGGRTVVGVSDLGLTTEIWTLPYEAVVDLIRRADRPEADAIVVSCTNVPTYDIIAPLEAEFGKPIVSANQATMWAALDAIGLSAVGPGQRLLAP